MVKKHTYKKKRNGVPMNCSNVQEPTYKTCNLIFFKNLSSLNLKVIIYLTN